MAGALGQKIKIGIQGDTNYVLPIGSLHFKIHANAIGWSGITIQKQAESTVSAPEAFGKWSKLVQVQDNGSTIRVVGPDTAFVKLTYTPHEDYEARGWGIPYSEEGILVDPVTYANEISVFLGDGISRSDISPNAEWHPQEKDLRGYSVQAAGSGEVGAMGLTRKAIGQFYVNGGVSFDDPGRAYVSGIAYPGNQFAYWSLTDSVETTEEGTGLFGLCWAGGPFMSATAKFVPLTHLTLKVSSDGGDAPQYVGTVTANPAKAGYGRSFMKDSAGHMTNVTGEVVHLHASPRCGYKFSHWKGSGKAWRGEIETPSDSAAHDLKDTDYFRGRSTITIRMDTDRELEAVFELAKRALVIEGGGVLFGTDAGSTLSFLRYKVISLSKPSLATVKDNINKGIDVFAFNGHGSGQSIELNYDDPNPLVPGETSYHSELVYLNSCGSADNNNGKSWIAMFNAYSFVGWHGSPGDYAADRFDEKFWKNIKQGQSTATAAYNAFRDLGYQRTQPFYPVWTGDVKLGVCTQ